MGEKKVRCCLPSYVWDQLSFAFPCLRNSHRSFLSLSVHIDTGTSLCAIDRVQTFEEEDDGEKKIGHDGIPHVAVVRVE